MPGEELIDAHRAHIESLTFGPAEEAGIKGESRVEIAGVKLAPPDMPVGVRRDFRRLHPLGRLENRKTCALRIRRHGKTADARNIVWRFMNDAAGLSDFLGVDVDIVNGDIADPM